MSYAYVDIPSTVIPFLCNLLDFFHAFIDDNTLCDFEKEDKPPGNYTTSWTLCVYISTTELPARFGVDFSTKLNKFPHMWVLSVPSLINSACLLLDKFMSSVMRDYKSWIGSPYLRTLSDHSDDNFFYQNHLTCTSLLGFPELCLVHHYYKVWKNPTTDKQVQIYEEIKDVITPLLKFLHEKRHEEIQQYKNFQPKQIHVVNRIPENKQWKNLEKKQWKKPEKKQWKNSKKEQWINPENEQWINPENEQWINPENEQWINPENEQWKDPKNEQWKDPEWKDPEWKNSEKKQLKNPKSEQWKNSEWKQWKNPKKEQWKNSKKEQWKDPDQVSIKFTAACSEIVEQTVTSTDSCSAAAVCPEVVEQTTTPADSCSASCSVSVYFPVTNNVSINYAALGSASIKHILAKTIHFQ